MNEQTKKLLFFYAIPAFVLAFSACLNVFMIASVSNVTNQIHAIELKREAIAKQNADLELSLAQTQSLSSVKEYAVAQGYVPVTTVSQVQFKSSQIAMQP